MEDQGEDGLCNEKSNGLNTGVPFISLMIVGEAISSLITQLFIYFKKYNITD